MKKALLIPTPFRHRFLITLATAGLLAFAVSGCAKKKEATPEKAPAASASAKPADPNADGKRLDRAVNDWKRRWGRINLEKCDALLKEPEELELCTKAEAALTTVKDQSSKLDKTQAALTAAGELILASEAAVEKLRAANMIAAGSAASAAPAAPKAAAPKPVKGAGVKGAGSAGPRKAARRDDPATKLVASYERTARSAARYLGSFLQQGPLEIRQQAFGEVTRLVPLREKWMTLRDVVRQASLTERNSDLKKQLRDLEQKLRAASAPRRSPRPSTSASAAAAKAAAAKAAAAKAAGHEDHDH